ncbi:YkvA family protein [Autumnicola edwardsiae]|uniref:YkvA family protein n=1 Tax=Autumnicola edwardsiae TaxID=3075594 RepID=A0ABU3CSU3_9FLAO|nr:YkvA family protein [Zunongwangia sp. F297]MDT0649434.1 YkvA family protein [Zunongwangia sp. F297]
MSLFSKENAEEEHNKRQKNFSKKDVDKVIAEEEKIKSKFESKGKLSRYLGDVQLLFSLVRDYANGSYREMPWNIVASVGGALLYVLSPIDIIPDFIPVIGYLDDAAVIAFCLNLIEKDLAAYKVWKDGIGTA